MRVAPGGGGGGTVVLIDPSTLQQAAGKVKITSQELRLAESALGQISAPAMPSDVAAVVESALAEANASLGPMPPELDQLVVELTRRAFWAEYADALEAGYNLSGTALQEFRAWMRDGTLLKYADTNEAIAAGRELAVAYSGFRKNPDQLIALALSLKTSEADGAGTSIQRAFAAGFVNAFGAKNMELVPRVIQAIEWSRQIAFAPGGITNPWVLQDVAVHWAENGKTLQEDPIKDLLAPFCMSLANATCSGMLAQQTSSSIAESSDTWATAALVSEGRFATPFLLQCFKSGVVDQIEEDSRLALAPGAMPETELPLGEMWSHGRELLPPDTKQIVLEALARNPEAAALALSQQIDAHPFDQFGEQQTITNPMELLYQYGHFADSGAAFGHAYVAATNYLPPAEATKLTVTALQQLVGHDHSGMSAFKDGIATDLADHHMGDLFDSAAAGITSTSIEIAQPGSYNYHPGQLLLSQQDLTSVMQKLADRPSAFQTLLHAGANYQAALIDRGTQSPPGSPQVPVWAGKVASFDATVLNATDLNRIENYDTSVERQRLVLGFFKDATDGVVTLTDPVAGAILTPGINAAFDSGFSAPDRVSVALANANAKQTTLNLIRSSIAAGYYEHGYIPHEVDGKPTLPTDLQGANGRIKPYGSLAAPAQASYDLWMNEDPHVIPAVAPAMTQVSGVFSDLHIDLSPS